MPALGHVNAAVGHALPAGMMPIETSAEMAAAAALGRQGIALAPGQPQPASYESHMAAASSLSQIQMASSINSHLAQMSDGNPAYLAGATALATGAPGPPASHADPFRAGMALADSIHATNRMCAPPGAPPGGCLSACGQQTLQALEYLSQTASAAPAANPAPSATAPSVDGVTAVNGAPTDGHWPQPAGVESSSGGGAGGVVGELAVTDDMATRETPMHAAAGILLEHSAPPACQRRHGASGGRRRRRERGARDERRRGGGDSQRLRGG